MNPRAYRLPRLLIVLLSAAAIVVVLLWLGAPTVPVIFGFWVAFVILVMVPNRLNQALTRYVYKYPVAMLFVPTIKGKEPADRKDFVIRPTTAEEILTLTRNTEIVTYNTPGNALMSAAQSRLLLPQPIHYLTETKFKRTFVYAYIVIWFTPDPTLELATIHEYLAAATVTYELWVCRRLQLMGLREDVEATAPGKE